MGLLRCFWKNISPDVRGLLDRDRVDFIIIEIVA
jgi:hypothetical protein